MEFVQPAIAAMVGLAAGAAFPGFQHLLYTEPDFRARPAAGGRLLALRAFSGVALGTCWGFAFRPDFYEAGPATLLAACLAVLVAVSSTDFDRRRIPNKITYPATVGVLCFAWAWPDRSVGDILVGTGAGLAAAILLVGLGALLGGGSMGLGVGDGKLMILIGAMVGWPGIVQALFFGILLAGAVAVALLVRSGRHATFSYGPYLAAGAALVLLFPGLR